MQNKQQKFWAIVDKKTGKIAKDWATPEIYLTKKRAERELSLYWHTNRFIIKQITIKI